MAREPEAWADGDTMTPSGGGRGAARMPIRGFVQRLGGPAGRDVSFSVLGTGIDLLGQFLLGALLARALGPAGVAAYYVGTTVGMLVLAPLSPGVATLIPREVARGRVGLGLILGAVLSLRVIVAIPVSLLLVTLAAFVIAPAYRGPILIGYGLVTFQHLIVTIQSSAEAIHRFDIKLLTTLLYRSGVVGSAVLCLIAGLTPIVVLIVQLVVTVAISVAVAVLVAPKVRDLDLRGGIRLWPDVVRRGYPILLTSLLFFLGLRLDSLVLSAFAPASEVGLYSTATFVVTAAAAPALAVVIGAFPTLVARLAAGRAAALALRMILVVLGYALLVVPTIAILGPVLLRLVFGDAFEPAAPLLAILAGSLTPMMLNRFVLYYLIASDRASAAWLASGAGLALATGLNLVLIPRLGASGAAIDAVVGESTVLLVGCVALVHGRRRGRRPQAPDMQIAMTEGVS